MTIGTRKYTLYEYWPVCVCAGGGGGGGGVVMGVQAHPLYPRENSSHFLPFLLILLPLLCPFNPIIPMTTCIYLNFIDLWPFIFIIIF